MRLSMMACGAASLLMLAACGGGEDSEAAEAPTAEQAALTLTERPALAEDVEALPRLSGEGAGIARINAEFDRLDAAALAEARECAAMAAEGPNGGEGEWSRTVTRPMTGPAYLTVRTHVEAYCGGAYPSATQTAISYDAASGERVNWTAALPGLNLIVETFEDMPQDHVAQVSSAALGAWYAGRMLATPDAEWVAECREVFDADRMAEQTFNIWADAEHGGVSVQPDFPHVIQACGETATLTPADLRNWNADAGLVAAIEAAHAAGNWAPKEEAAAE